MGTKMSLSLEAILPSSKFPDATVWLAALRRAVDKSQSDVLNDLRNVTATWEHTPRWRTRFREDSGELIMEISTTDKAFIFLDQGTGSYGEGGGAYPIRPKDLAGFLKFKSGYTAKTTPGVLSSGAGGRYGDDIFRKEVMHPGIKPRGWLELIKTKSDPKFRDYVMEELVKLPKLK